MLTVSQEHQYLDLIRRILNEGEQRDDRTGTGTISIFAPPQMRFKLDTFPLLTTKKMYLRGIFEELLWFIQGKTDSRILSSKNVKIWDANQLDVQKRLGYEPGDLGPIYGFQWRHFGAQYNGLDHDYNNEGVDQLAEVFKSLLFNPMSRRIILSAWNPYGNLLLTAVLDQMALPPCHIFCQFYVSDRNGKSYLSCQMYQRSCDMGLGVPYNIASYSMLTMMIAKIVGYEPDEFIHCMGDCHVYRDHVDALNVQCAREPFPFPGLEINLKTVEKEGRDPAEVVNECIAILESTKFEDLKLVDYKSHDKIVMQMSV